MDKTISETCRENRLGINSLMVILRQFQRNLNIIGWNEWGNLEEDFQPFERLSMQLENLWIMENFTKVPVTPFSSMHMEVRWIPKYNFNISYGDVFAEMEFNNYLATSWMPGLVAIRDDAEDTFFIWDKQNKKWAEFVMNINEKNDSHKAFFKLLSIWINEFASICLISN